MPDTLLFLKLDEQRTAATVRSAMRKEDFVPHDDIATARRNVERDPASTRLFVISPEGEWCVVAEYGNQLDLDLAAAIASSAEADGWILAQVPDTHVALWKVTAGQREDQAQASAQVSAQEQMQKAGLPSRLMQFVAKEHLAQESVKQGKHRDILLGFKAPRLAQTSEVARALAEPSAQKNAPHVPLTLAGLLRRAVKHERVRAIALAQIQEQLRRDGFDKELAISNAVAEGHYCEAFEAESFSFESNGPYNWFDWSCEEACEPRLPEEKAFPACDLRFRLETL